MRVRDASVRRHGGGTPGASGRVSVFVAIGLPVLYASAYFVPPLLPAGAYLLPDVGLARQILVPSVVTILVLAVLVYGACSLAQRWLDARLVMLGAVVALTCLTLIGAKGVLETAGLHWQDRVPRGHDLQATEQYVRLAAFLVALAVVSSLRARLPQVGRLLSSVGYALAAVALIRFCLVWHAHGATPTAVGSEAAIRSVSAHSLMAPPVAVVPGARPRRVVWLIFDEADFDRIDDARNHAPSGFPNFNWLAQASVFALHANSPASATLYSIPSLLSGVPVDDVKVNAHSELTLDSAGKSLPFGESTSIFGALAGLRLSASVLGFFHPYCRLFVLTRCSDFPWPDVGGIADALLANVPSSVVKPFRRVRDWGDISAEMLALLPQFVARADALTFVHLNIPHLPATYADRILNLPASPDPLVEYSRNLLITDRILGAVLRQLRQPQPVADVMLIVSTDHWLRNRWYQANVPETSRAVLFAVWKVGESQGTQLSYPVSTVHTAAMILDYLRGAISSQADIAAWWSRQAVFPTYVAPNT